MKKLIFGLAALAGAAAGAYFLAKKLGGEGCPFCAHDEEEEPCPVSTDDCCGSACEEKAPSAEEEKPAATPAEENVHEESTVQ